MARITTKEAFNALNGLFCIYKPGARPMAGVIGALKTALVSDINSFPIPERPRLVFTEPEHNQDLPVVTTVPDLAQHPLVLGPRFVPEDFHLEPVDKPGPVISGVTVVRINGSLQTMQRLRFLSHVQVFHIHCRLGLTTHNCLPNGRVIQRTTYNHVKAAYLDRILAAIQATHHRQIYRCAGLDLQTQEAYEVATQGLLRARIGPRAGPVIYGIKCIHFEPPDFILECHLVNAGQSYLTQLVQSMSLQLKSSAVCTKIRRIRIGPFGLPHALLQKHWRVESIIENISVCRPLVSYESLRLEQNLIDLEQLESS